MMQPSLLPETFGHIYITKQCRPDQIVLKSSMIRDCTFFFYSLSILDRSPAVKYTYIFWSFRTLNSLHLSCTRQKISLRWRERAVSHRPFKHIDKFPNVKFKFVLSLFVPSSVCSHTASQNPLRHIERLNKIEFYVCPFFLGSFFGVFFMSFLLNMLFQVKPFMPV